MTDVLTIVDRLQADLGTCWPGHAEARTDEIVAYDRRKVTNQIMKRLEERGLPVAYLTIVPWTAGGSLVMATIPAPRTDG